MTTSSICGVFVCRSQTPGSLSHNVELRNIGPAAAHAFFHARNSAWRSHGVLTGSVVEVCYCRHLRTVLASWAAHFHSPFQVQQHGGLIHGITAMRGAILCNGCSDCTTRLRGGVIEALTGRPGRTPQATERSTVAHSPAKKSL